MLRLTAILALCVACSTLLAAPLPVESFSQLPRFRSVELSPSGDKVAFVQNTEDLSVLSVLDFGTRKTQHLVKTDNIRVHVKWVEWVNDDTLLLSLRLARKRYGKKTYESRLFAMAVDGSDKEPRDLFKVNKGKMHERSTQFQDRVIDMLPDDPDHVLIALDTDYFAQPTVFKLNINNGQRELVEGGKKDVRRWYTDQQHRVRAGYSMDYETGLVKIYTRDEVEGPWKVSFSYESFSEPEIYVSGFDLEPNILYYQAHQDDRLALFRVDLETGERTLVLSHPERDLDGSLIYSTKTRRPVGIAYPGASNGIKFWDEERASLEARLDQTFPDTTNRIVSFNRDESVFILKVESDSTPAIYYLVDKTAFRFTRLFRTYPQLDDVEEIKHRQVSYKARDGLEIEGYLTVPTGTEGPIPTILHPHGGPGSRDYSGFDFWTSFFVNQGYAVFRPNFRGSSGYGFEFASASYERWGLEMQDDLEDAAKWLVAESIADPKRMCIVGASYGGYAALMAAATSPELFQCAVSFAGVTDLQKLINGFRRTVGFDLVKKQIGSGWFDLRARSPLHRAEEFGIPVLLMHGDVDRVVSIDHSIRLADELEHYKKDFKFVTLEDGDHHLGIQANRHKAFSEMSTFLKKYLQ